MKNAVENESYSEIYELYKKHFGQIEKGMDDSKVKDAIRKEIQEEMQQEL